MSIIKSLLNGIAGVAGKDTKSNTNIGSNLIGLNPFYNLRPTNPADKATRDAVVKFKTTGECVAPYSNEYLEKQSALAFPRDSKYNNKKENIFEDTTTDTSSLRRDFHNETTFNKEKAGQNEEKNSETIYNAPTRPTSISNDMLQQILELNNRDHTKYYYNEDYEKHATVKTDSNGNVTYTFTNSDGGISSNSYTTTEYYFEVKDAKYWQEKLDYDVGISHKMFDNKVVDAINQYLEVLIPPGADVLKAEYAAGMFQIITDILAWATEGEVTHHTATSRYLYDKVASKNPNEKVPILKSAVTYRVYKDSDGFHTEKVLERDFLEEKN